MAILCMESGGTKLIVSLADDTGSLGPVFREYRRPAQQARDTLEQLISMGKKLIPAGDGLRAVSFGFGGIVHRPSGRPYVCFHEEGWQSLQSRELLKDAFGVPVFVENDCNLAALGEAHRGAGLKQGTLFYATLGTGIGGSLVRNGQLLQLGEWGEGELGHIVVEEDGPPCPCGNRGCLETLCSGPGLARLAEQMTDLRTDSESLMHAYQRKENEATRVVQRAAHYLGQVFGGVINLLQPSLLVLGGGLMKSNTSFLEEISRRTEPFVFPLFRGKSRFVLSRLEERAVCQGAAVYALQQLSMED